jgi:hypothetical protein
MAEGTKPMWPAIPAMVNPFKPWLATKLNAAWAICRRLTSVSNFWVPIL